MWAPLDPAVVASADLLRDQLTACGSQERAVRERAYLKSSYEHCGVAVPKTRSLTRAWLRSHDITTHDQVAAAAAALWDCEVYESRFAAVEVLVARRSTLGAGDLPQCEMMLRSSHTWALVDPLAINVVGAIVGGHPDVEPGARLDSWAVDEDFWIRRAALLSQLPVVRAVDGDPARFFRYAGAMLSQREFFIRKAIGWVLRDMGRRRPEVVYDWLLPRAREASGVTVREAVKVLDDEQRATILAARS
jgi:3-methyladenine DNA glycosylase AlkD